MKTHEVTVHIDHDTFERVNRLLKIPSLDALTDRELRAQGANTGHNEGIYSAKFDDGSSINFDLCSDSNNYWDDVVWTSPDGRTDITLDCEYELGDIEVEIETGLYKVKVAVDSPQENRRKDESMALWNQLVKHLGHSVSIVTYGNADDPVDVCLECEDCDEVVLDAELYTICARSENQSGANNDRSEGMPLSEIIGVLRDQVKDRESLVDKDDPNCIFRHDASALRVAVELLEGLKAKKA